MAINSDTDINLALLQLGKNANRYRLDQLQDLISQQA